MGAVRHRRAVRALSPYRWRRWRMLRRGAGVSARMGWSARTPGGVGGVGSSRPDRAAPSWWVGRSRLARRVDVLRRAGRLRPPSAQGDVALCLSRGTAVAQMGASSGRLRSARRWVSQCRGSSTRHQDGRMPAFEQTPARSHAGPVPRPSDRHRQDRKPEPGTIGGTSTNGHAHRRHHTYVIKPATTFISPARIFPEIIIRRSPVQVRPPLPLTSTDIYGFSGVLTGSRKGNNPRKSRKHRTLRRTIDGTRRRCAGATGASCDISEPKKPDLSMKASLRRDI